MERTTAKLAFGSPPKLSASTRRKDSQAGRLLATCPHCRKELASGPLPVGELQACPQCHGLSMTFREGGRLLALERTIQGDLHGDALAPFRQGDDIVIRGIAAGALDLSGETLAGTVVLERCLLERVTLSGAELHGGVNIEDVVITRDLTLDAHVAGTVRLHDVVVGEDLTLQDGAFEGDVDAWRLRVGGELNASAATFGGLGHFRHGVFTGDASFIDARFGGEANFSYSTFRGSLDLTMADIDNGLEGFMLTVEGSAAMEVNVKGWADLTHSRFRGPANFENATFEDGAEFGNVSFQAANFARCTFGGEAVFTFATFAEALELDVAVFQGVADFRHAIFHQQVDGNRSRFDEAAYFQAARFKSAFLFSGVRFSKAAHFDQVVFEAGVDLGEASTGGHLIMREARFDAPASAQAAVSRVTYELDLHGMTLGRDLDLSGCRVGATVNMTDLYLYGSFWAEDARFARAIAMNRASVNGFLEWKNAEFDGPVDFSDAKVGAGVRGDGVRTRDIWNWTGTHVCGGDTTFTRGEFQGPNRFGQGTTFGGRLSLRDATFTEKLDLSQVQMHGTLELLGIRADHLRLKWQDWKQALDAKKPRLHSEREAMLGHPKTALARLLGQYPPEHKEKGKRFSDAAEEYAILRRACLAVNDHDGADWAHFRNRVCRRRHRTWEYHRDGQGVVGPIRGAFGTALRLLEKWILEWGSGYGTSPLRVLGMMLIVGLVFVPVYMLSPAAFTVSQGTFGLDEAALLSYSTLLSFGLENVYPEVTSGVVKYIYLLEGFLGIGLVTLFISTLSRKIIQ